MTNAWRSLLITIPRCSFAIAEMEKTRQAQIAIAENSPFFIDPIPDMPNKAFPQGWILLQRKETLTIRYDISIFAS